MRRDDPGRHSGWDEGMRERVVVKEVPVERVVEKEVRVEVPKIVLQPIDVVREITVEVVNEVPKEIVREVPIIEIREVEVEVIKYVDREVIKEVEVVKEVPVEVIKYVEVEKIVEKIIEVPKIVEVEVQKIIEKEVVTPVEVIREVPVEVTKIVEKEVVMVVEKEVPAEVVKEVVKEVYREVIKEVEVEGSNYQDDVPLKPKPPDNPTSALPEVLLQSVPIEIIRDVVRGVNAEHRAQNANANPAHLPPSGEQVRYMPYEVLREVEVVMPPPHQGYIPEPDRRLPENRPPPPRPHGAKAPPQPTVSKQRLAQLERMTSDATNRSVGGVAGSAHPGMAPPVRSIGGGNKPYSDAGRRMMRDEKGGRGVWDGGAAAALKETSGEARVGARWGAPPGGAPREERWESDAQRRERDARERAAAGDAKRLARAVREREIAAAGGGGGKAPAKAPSPRADVRAAFERYDRNRSGFLDYRELRNALEHMGYDVDEAAAAEVLRVYDDRPHDGKMDIGEFAQLVHDLAPRLGKGKKGGGGGGGGGAGSSSARLPPGSAAARAADVRSAFEYYDRNRSGFLDYRELRNALAHMGYEPTEAAAVEVLRAYDDRADGKMDVGEFTRLVGDLEGRRGGGKGGAKAPARASAATDKARADAREKRLRGEAARAAFKESDRNRSGYLDVRELRGALGQMGFDVSEAAAAEVLRAYDDKPDGLLDVHEFTKLVHDLEARKAAGGAKPKAAAAAGPSGGGGAARATSASVGRQTRARRLRVAGSPPLEGDESGEEEPPQRVAGPLSAW